ncbi:RQC-minor-1 family DNA-binding protein [Paenibacillus piri]|uniref:Superfamily II DNA helicase n=1 Tax=Paenibacillus piri TaxID=2547395 RepID=A0A4R5KND6_9BACL|nr:RQC-minor-1 family DNA-binding protein [Paenibacillus piri]TDF97066.1 superfamily II DNA helicase [Paenibacillus piri]
MIRRNMPLPDPELRAILRAADDIIAEGGRTLLSKILKGSKERQLLELGLDRNPSYGFYKDLSLEQIMEKVDHMIRTDFLKTEKSGKLPMIVYTTRGWAVERERRAEEFLEEWNRWLENNISPISMEYLKERNRGMIFLFLYKILCSGNKKYVPYLTLWERIEFKKVRVEIRNVIEALKRRVELDDSAWERLERERAETLIIRSRDPILMVCQQCDDLFLFDETNPEYYTSEGLRFPEKCRNCSGG